MQFTTTCHTVETLTTDEFIDFSQEPNDWELFNPIPSIEDSMDIREYVTVESSSSDERDTPLASSSSSPMAIEEIQDPDVDFDLTVPPFHSPPDSANLNSFSMLSGDLGRTNNCIVVLNVQYEKDKELPKVYVSLKADTPFIVNKNLPKDDQHRYLWQLSESLGYWDECTVSVVESQLTSPYIDYATTLWNIAQARGLKSYFINSRTMKAFFGISTGDHYSNKKAAVTKYKMLRQTYEGTNYILAPSVLGRYSRVKDNHFIDALLDALAWLAKEFCKVYYLDDPTRKFDARLPAIQMKVKPAPTIEENAVEKRKYKKRKSAYQSTNTVTFNKKEGWVPKVIPGVSFQRVPRPYPAKPGRPRELPRPSE